MRFKLLLLFTFSVLFGHNLNGQVGSFTQSSTPTTSSQAPNGCSGNPTSASPQIYATAPSDGKYLIIGRGMMGSTSTSYCQIYLYNGTTQISKADGFSSNNTTSSTSIYQIADLIAGDKIELKYSNDNNVSLNYGYPGDKVIIIKVGDNAQSLTPTTPTTAPNGCSGIPTSASPQIYATAPSDGKYLIIGRGLMGSNSSSYCQLYLYNGTTQISKADGFSSNNTTNSAPIYQLADLKSGDKIELKYSNDNNTNLSFGYPGDKVILVKVGENAESSTPTNPSQATSGCSGSPTSASPQIYTTAPSNGKYLILGRGLMGATATSYCQLYLYNGTTQISEADGFSSNITTRSSPIYQIIGLNSGDKIELKYSNNNNVNLNYGYPGDKVILLKEGPPWKPGITKNLQNDNFSIYPNPTKGIVNFSNPCNIDVFNSFGLLIDSKLNITSFDISELPVGIYVINVSEENGHLIRRYKIIKE